jgi:hypothetical protein
VIDRVTPEWSLMLSTAAMENISIVWKPRALAANISATAWNINGFMLQFFKIITDKH